MWTGPTWEQRMFIMRRFGEFAKKRGPEMSEEHVPLFIVSLKLAKNSAVQYTRALLSPMGAGKAPAQMFLSGLRRAAAENPARQVRPTMRGELGLVCNAMWPERDCVAIRFAWVTASPCDEIALVPKKNFIEPPGGRNALIFDRALRQKHSRHTRTEQRAA
ncbi:hypothetical protein TRVL_08940 [Trypanosoma vivax]|nr:hypothetical protein TRVL_08940 [Trypanosoma vivax]